MQRILLFLSILLFIILIKTVNVLAQSADSDTIAIDEIYSKKQEQFYVDNYLR